MVVCADCCAQCHRHFVHENLYMSTKNQCARAITFRLINGYDSIFIPTEILLWPHRHKHAVVMTVKMLIYPN